jgi:glycosyltransferase involved in cell wall biosynthesis
MDSSFKKTENEHRKESPDSTNARLPKVSVIIPTYNRARFLPNAIKSIIDQKYDNLEIIIVDDGSTDNTQSIVNSLREKCSKIVFCHNARSKGPSGARNTGILISTGNYLSFLDSDDVWLSGHLTTGVKVLNEPSDIDILFRN